MGKKRNKRKKTKRQTKVAYTLTPSGLNIPDLQEVSDKIPYRQLKPVFSFKYYDEKDDSLSVKCFGSFRELCLLFKHLKMSSQMTWGDMEDAHGFHAHEFHWSHTSRPKGFPPRLSIPEGFAPYQFKAFDKYRIVGFHKDKVFYVVWFDSHQLFPE